MAASLTRRTGTRRAFAKSKPIQPLPRCFGFPRIRPLRTGAGKPIEAASKSQPRAACLNLPTNSFGAICGPEANSRSTRPDMSSLTQVPPISTTRILFFMNAHPVAVARRYRPRPNNRPTRRDNPLGSGLAAVMAGQHSTISKARKRNNSCRADFKSTRKFLAICCTERVPLNCEANWASSDVNFNFCTRSKPSLVKAGMHAGSNFSVCSGFWTRRSVSSAQSITFGSPGKSAKSLKRPAFFSNIIHARGVIQASEKSFCP